jgi:Ca2+-binding RTX toxin-like protein
MDGKGGVNAMYGGQSINVFLSGDATYNQIWGGHAASVPTGSSGYENNTVDYSPVGAGSSVYVDLLNGHNAYIVTGGVYTYEDSLANVPNVSGSAGADIIQCDNARDVINGRAGGDQLYAGTGNNRGADTFVYSQYADSNVVNGYDTIVGFQSGLDKIDASALHLTPNSIVIQSNASSTVLYLEATAGTFNPNTDLAISFTKGNAVQASDVIL